MSKYSNYNIVYRLQKWMDSVAGQTFMNYAYSWGASIVILGTLFKLTHLPGANLMLFIGMGTEVFVFFISAFDRPFDKTQDGKELETSRSIAEREQQEKQLATGGVAEGPAVSGGGTIIIGGGAGEVAPVATGTETVSGDTSGGRIIGGTGGWITPAPAVSQETAEAMEEATTTYVERLTQLNEMLFKVAAQSERLTTDSQEMENLNRTLTGIAKVYEMQLKTASQQIGAIDEVNDKTRKMVGQIEALNNIYARMIEAMSNK